MPDEGRRTIITRADRMLRQSKTLRKMSEGLLKESKDLLKESEDIRRGVKKLAKKRRS
jgi:hypothetical protein